MRVYALLLGTLLTAASSYVAEIAVESTGLARVQTALRATTDPPAAAAIWYGGALKPITVQTFIAPRPALTVRALDRLGATAHCARPAQGAPHAISTE